jgi:hypothetical protein
MNFSSVPLKIDVPSKSIQNVLDHLEKHNTPMCFRQMKMGKLERKICFHHKYLYSTL